MLPNDARELLSAGIAEFYVLRNGSRSENRVDDFMDEPRRRVLTMFHLSFLCGTSCL
jgi:hypothetical protein